MQSLSQNDKALSISEIVVLAHQFRLKFFSSPGCYPTGVWYIGSKLFVFKEYASLAESPRYPITSLRQNLGSQTSRVDGSFSTVENVLNKGYFMQLILDKLSAPAELPRLSRSRLLTRLNNSLAAGNMTIINGRAGTGKTLLAADFASHCGRKVAWYTVEAADSEPKIFFQYLITSIRQQRRGFGENWGEEGQADKLQALAESDMPQLAEAFIYELLEHPGEPLLLVIDDLHLVYDADWVVAFFSRFAPLLPPDVHLLILGRILPPAPLWRMRSKQTLSIIDEAGLIFTLEEAQQLFAGYGIAGEEAYSLFHQARGRAAQVDALARLRSQNSAGGNLTNRLPQQIFA